MKRSLFVIVGVSVAACSSGGGGAAPAGSGGAPIASGGIAGLGGSATGGTESRGGASAGGAANGGRASGGVTGTGGVTSIGGNPGTGGAPPTPSSGPVVATKSGKVQGYVKGSTNAFLGIPYAAPPVGDRRFAPPAAPAPWSDVRAVTMLGAVCPQKKGPTTIFSPNPPPQNEDCLTLNVYAPAAKAAKAPVIVYFHAGGFNNGTSSDYDGSALSEAGNVVVITANYRLGALGFLLNADLDKALGGPSGNMGLRDQQFVLSWVKDNVAEFGGDPDNVTLLGESCLHVFAEGSRTLAKRFVVDGPSCVSNPVGSLVRSSVQWQSDKLVTQLCPDTPDVAQCLRDLPADKLATFVNNDNTDPGPDPLGQGFRPQVDGTTLKDYPKALLASGDFHHGPILTGASLKAATITRLDPSTTKDLMTKLNFGFYAIFTYITQWSTLQSMYTPATDADAVDSFERLSTDTWFRCPIRALARGAAAKGTSVYFYSFDLAPATTGQDLDYVFGVPVTSPALKAPPFDTAAPNPLAPDLVHAMQSYVTAFAKSGDPNQAAFAEWPTYTSTADQHLSLNSSLSVATAFSKKECDTWDTANAASAY